MKRNPPQKECSTPPDHPVEWLACTKSKIPVTVRVTSKTWYDARNQAMRILHCSPDDLEVTLV